MVTQASAAEPSASAERWLKYSDLLFFSFNSYNNQVIRLSAVNHIPQEIMLSAGLNDS